MCQRADEMGIGMLDVGDVFVPGPVIFNCFAKLGR